jgi:hypothetical protein
MIFEVIMAKRDQQKMQTPATGLLEARARNSWKVSLASIFYPILA